MNFAPYYLCYPKRPTESYIPISRTHDDKKQPRVTVEL